MLVYVESTGLSFSNDTHRVLPIYPESVSLKSETAQHYTPGFVRKVSMFDVLRKDEFTTAKANNLARRLANPTEPVWFMNLDMDAPLYPNSPFKGRLAENQAKLLPLITRTYECDDVDAEGLIAAGVDHTPPEQSYAAVNAYLAGYGRDACAQRSPLNPLFWRHKADAFAWIMGVREAREIPHLQSLGFDFDTVQKMDEEAAESWVTFIGTVFATQAGERLIENVNIAAKVALDSPQPVTIDVGPKDDEGKTDFTITFENVRLTPQVAGLRITLPTGGIVFLRDVSLNSDNGDVVRSKRGKLLRVSNRYIARRIVEQLASDTQWLYEGWSCNVYATAKPVTDYLNSYRDYLNRAES